MPFNSTNPPKGDLEDSLPDGLLGKAGILRTTNSTQRRSIIQDLSLAGA
jgi:hypothetical protein